MFQSELVSLLISFSKNEMRRAEQFLKSPYHNTNQTALQLFQYSRRYHPQMDSHRLDRKHVYAHLYGNDEFDWKRLRGQMSKLKKLLEQFLLQEQLQKEKHLQDRLLVNACFEKFTYEQLSSLIQTCIDDLEKEGVRDAEYYQKMLWLREELYYHPDRSMYKTDKHSVLALIQTLDRQYALSKLRYETDQHVRKEVIQEDGWVTFDIDALLDDFAQIKGDHELIDLYLELYQFRRVEATAEDFEAAISRLSDRFALMGKKEKSYLISCFINTAIYYHNKGKKAFTTLVAQLYEIADSEDLILYRGRLQAGSFLNAAIICSSAGKFEWSRIFIDKYGPYLAPEDRDYTINLAFGYWYFLNSKQGTRHQRQLLEKAHEHLSTIQYCGLLVDLRLRSLQLRVYYELEFLKGNIEVFSSFAGSFEKWLQRNSVLAREKSEVYLNFVRLSKQLIKFTGRNARSTEKIDELREKIESQEPHVLRDWLMEKVEELY